MPRRARSSSHSLAGSPTARLRTCVCLFTVSWVKGLVGALMFLVFADDWGCAYSSHIGAPLGWVHGIFVEPLPIKVRLLDLILLGVLVAASFKRDTRGAHVSPMKNALFLALGTTIFSFAWGLVHGGDSRAASWQILLDPQLHPLRVHSGCYVSDRGRLRHSRKVADGRGNLSRTGLLDFIFTWGSSTVGEGGAFLTTHDDTIGWVVCILILIVNAIERRSTAVTLRNLALIAFFLGAIQFNSRRLAWVSLAMGLVITYFLFPEGRVKRRVKRLSLIMAPVLAVYVVVGWGQASPIFLPLRAFATVSTQEDASTLARNAENLGLIATANVFGPAWGSGWGRPYICLTYKYTIADAFELWQYVPHNSILGLLAFTGALGFAGFWLAIPTAVFLNARVARLSTDPLARNVAIIGAAQMIVCANQFYGDMGTFFFKPMYVMGISYAIALRLPRSTGVWTAPTKAPTRGQ